MEIIANIIIPIITFGLGIGINWRYNRKNKHRELSLYRELVINYSINLSTKNIYKRFYLSN